MITAAECINGAVIVREYFYGKTKNICKTLSRAGHYRRGVAGRVYYRCFSEMLMESDWKPFKVVMLMLVTILISTLLGFSFYVFR